MAVSTPPKWASELMDLLGRQRRIYHQLDELSRRQSQMVDNGDAETLLSVLASRQTLIDELAKMNERMEPFKRDWARLWMEMDGALQGQVQTLIDEVRRLLEGIIERDERDRASLNVQRGETAQELNKLNRGIAMNKAYKRQPPSAGGGGRFSDHQG